MIVKNHLVVLLPHYYLHLQLNLMIKTKTCILIMNYALVFLVLFLQVVPLVTLTIFTSYIFAGQNAVSVVDRRPKRREKDVFLNVSGLV